MRQFSKWIVACVCLSTMAGFTACNDDDVYVDVDGQAPIVDLSSTNAWIEGGRDLVIAGTLKDADGIAKIDIYCPELLVNKTIDLLAINDGEAPTEYELSYKIQTKNHIQEGDNFTVHLTVTDVGGRKTETPIEVRLDGDTTAPIFTSSPDAEMSVLIKPGEATSFNLEFSITDNQEIDYVEVKLQQRFLVSEAVPEEGIPAEYRFEEIPEYPNEVIPVNNKSYSYSKNISFPDDQERVLLATITACDKEKNEAAHFTEINSLITLTPLTPNFRLWLCDVEDVADLSKDVFGVPMLVDNVGPYKYAARYYNEKAGTKIFFLGQKGNFGPICFGPSKNDPDTLGDSYDAVDRITLDKENVYYLIEFNTKDGDYNVSTYSIEEAIDPIMHMHYGEDDLNTWWETNPDNMEGIWWQKFVIGPAGDPGGVEGNEMTQDTKNKHIFIRDNWNLPSGVTRFAIQAWHSHGWWNFESWRVDNSDEPEKFMYYGNYHPDTPHYTNNKDYFDWKYGDPEYMHYAYPDNPDFDLNSWGDENYRKNFVPDNWVNAHVVEPGKYRLIFDAHLERAKLIPID